MSGISRHCPAFGGAMADESGRNAGDLKSEALAGQRLDPKIGPIEALRKAVGEILLKMLPKIMQVLEACIEKGDVSIVKLLFELMFKLEAGKEDPQVVLESLAELLMRELEGTPVEGGTEAETGVEGTTQARAGE